jgi:hypothetical protein
MDRDRRSSRRGGRAVIGIILVVIVAVLVIGLLLKLLKIAIVLALAVGMVMFAQNKLGRNRDSGRIR